MNKQNGTIIKIRPKLFPSFYTNLYTCSKLIHFISYPPHLALFLFSGIGIMLNELYCMNNTNGYCLLFYSHILTLFILFIFCFTLFTLIHSSFPHIIIHTYIHATQSLFPSPPSTPYLCTLEHQKILKKVKYHRFK